MLTQEQREKLLNLLKQTADKSKSIEEEYDWNCIYWEVVRIETIKK